MSEKKESFVRWQERSIEQLGFVNNLIMGLSTGLFAFQLKIIFDASLPATDNNRWIFELSIVFIFLSLLVGIFVAWNRLRSFRATAQIARSRETNQRESIDENREKTKKLDNLTWFLLSTQSLFFAFGVLALFVFGLLFMNSQ